MPSTCRKDDSVPVTITDAVTRPILVPRVIILDDDGDAWTPVIRSMRERGLGVLVGSANDSALDVVTACEAEVVILALGSAARAGLDFMARVKAASPDTEVILLAGDVSVEETIAAHRAGAYDVVRTPFQPCDLGPSILRAVEKRRQKREAAAVLRDGQRLLSVRERAQLPALAVEFTRRAMGADIVSLMLRDTSGRLYIAQAHGLPSEVVTGTRLHMGQRIAGRVAELRTPVLFDDELFNDARFEDLAPFGRVQSSIIYPLLVGDRTIGVLNIGRSGPDGPFVRADLERAGVVASQIVLALETLKQWQRTGMADRLAIVGQLAASVAHEINNPLAAVVGQNGLALDAVEDVLARLRSGPALGADELRTALLDIRSCLEDTRVAASALQAVASDLRTAIRGDATQAHTFEVAETVRGAVRLATAELKRQIAIVTEVEPRLFAAGDSGLLCQVFLNLVLNANQALRAAATPAPEIRIAARRVEGEVRIDVTDNGPGIALEDQRRIFEPFYPGSSTGARTGLGLSIVNDIVQGFGARIEVSSRPGEGTSFSVYLPEAPIAATSFVRGLEDTQPAGAAS